MSIQPIDEAAYAEHIREIWRRDMGMLCRLMGRGVMPGEELCFAVFQDDGMIMSAEEATQLATREPEIRRIRVPYSTETLSPEDRLFVIDRLGGQEFYQFRTRPIHVGARPVSGRMTATELNVLQQGGSLSRIQNEMTRVLNRHMEALYNQIFHIEPREPSPLQQAADEFMREQMRIREEDIARSRRPFNPFEDNPLVPFDPHEPLPEAQYAPPTLEQFADESVDSVLEPTPMETLAEVGLQQEQIEEQNMEMRRKLLRDRINAPMANRVDYESPNYVPSWAKPMESKDES